MLHLGQKKVPSSYQKMSYESNYHVSYHSAISEATLTSNKIMSSRRL